MSIIEIKNLTKTYKGGNGIYDISFNVNQGEIFGLLGPDSAGKTTIMRILMDYLKPDSGECLIFGLDCRKKSSEILKSVGYLPEEINFKNEMSGTDFIKYIAKLREITDFKKTIELLKLFDFDPKDKIKKMPKAMKQKLGLLCAFMHDPQVIILDEPTKNLSPLMKNCFAELILNEKANGKTILIASESFEEIEKTCEKTGLIIDGYLVKTEDVSVLQSRQKKKYDVILETEDMARHFANENIDVVSVHKNIVTVRVSGDMTPFIWAMSKYRIIGLNNVKQDLEEILMQCSEEENFNKIKV